MTMIRSNTKFTSNLKRTLSTALTAAGITLLAGSSAHAVPGTGAVFSTTQTDLTNGANYTPSIANPKAAGTIDVQFGGPYGTTTLTDNGTALVFNTLNDLDTSDSLTITDNGAASSISLGSTADTNSTVGAGSTADLLFVASGANLTIQNGTGTLTLLLANNGNIDDAGTLNLAGPISITTGKSITFDGVGTTTVSGAIANTSGIVKVAVGMTELTGTNLYTGVTTITSGTLELGGSGSLGSGSYAGNIAITNASTNANPAMFIDASSTNQILSGIISGAGALTLSGPGTLKLTGSNTFTGVTTVSASTLILGNNLALQDSTLNTSGGGVVTVTGFTTPTIGGLTGSTNLASVITTGYGSITALTLNPTTVSAAYSGVIADGATGMTLTKSGSGTQTLSGANTYTGSTMITAGTLSVSADNNLGTAPGSATAADLVINGGTLGVSSSFTLNSNRGISLGASGTGAINVASGQTLTYGGIIASTGGGLSATGSGTLILSGANTYTAGTAITNGTVIVANTQALGTGATGSVTLQAATLDLQAGPSTVAYNIGMNSTTSGTIVVDNASSGAGVTYSLGTFSSNGTETLTVTQGANNTGGGGVTFTGAATFGSGSRVLNVAPGLTLTLASVNNTNSSGSVTFGGGGTTIVTGTWNQEKGVIVNNATLTVDQGITSLTGNVSVTGTMNVGNGGSAQLATGGFYSSGSITLGSNSLFNYDSSASQTIQDAITGTTTSAVTQSGSGTLTLFGANTYGGATTISAGALALSGGSASLGATAVTIGNGATLQVINGNSAIGTSGVASVTVNSGGTLSMVDGATNTLTLNTTSGNALVLSGGGTIGFDVGATSDEIVLASGTASVSGTSTITINSLGGLTGATQTLISAANGGLGTTGFTLGTITGSTGGYTLTLNETDTNLFLVETNGSVATAAYWSGTNGSAWNASPFNFNTDMSSGIPVSALPSSVTNVTFNATGASNFSSTTLGQDFTINSLTFNTAGVGIGGANTLTIMAGNANGNTMGNGINSSGSGTNTISSAVALGSTQTWTAASGNTLNVSGAVSESGGSYTLSTAGSGVVALNSSTGNTYSGGTSVTGSSTLVIGNTSNSATGTGAVNVARGAALAGTGIINATTGSITLGSAVGSGLAQVYVGQAAGGDTGVTSVLTLKSTPGMSITNTNLTFNLNANSVGGSGTPGVGGLGASGSGNELSVGATTITFGAGDSLTLNIQGLTNIAANTPYVLFAGTGSGAGVGGSQYLGLGNGGTDANGNIIITGLTLNFGGAQPPATYANSYLFLNQVGGVDDIEVEIVPEPSTYIMMLAGLAVLVFWQRRRSS